MAKRASFEYLHVILYIILVGIGLFFLSKNERKIYEAIYRNQRQLLDVRKIIKHNVRQCMFVATFDQ